MRELRRSADFALESGEHPWVSSLLRSDQFHGARPFHHLVFGQIDFAHTARTQLSFESILAQLLGRKRLSPQSTNRIHTHQRRHYNDRDSQYLPTNEAGVIRPARERNIGRIGIK